MEDSAERASPHTQGDPLSIIGSEKGDNLSVIGSEKGTTYPLSEVAFEALAALAPTLKEAELRVLIELTRRHITTGHGIRASSRELASCCKLARSKVVPALDSLATRGLITTRQGTTTQAAAYLINFVRTVTIGGPLTGPPPRQTWSPTGTTQVPLWDHPGPQEGPPPTENAPLTRPNVRLDSVPSCTPILDRVLRSKPKDHDAEHLAYFRRWLHGYMRKLGRDVNNQPTPDAHPPDDEIVAQFLAVDEPERLSRLLDTLLTDRITTYSYAWFVTVALQRLHGVTYKQTRAARETLRVVKRGQKQQTRPEQQEIDPQFSTDLIQQATAGIKKLR